MIFAPNTGDSAPPLRRRTTGQALVELALILPLVLGLLFAIIDLGYYLFVNVSVTHATREGVRFAAMNNRTRAEVESWIHRSAPGVAIPSTGAITITTIANDPDFGDGAPSVAIQVAFPHTFLVPLFMIGKSTGNVFSESKMIVQTFERVPGITF